MESDSSTTTKTAYKLMPMIEKDACMGCGLCAKACEARCIEMVWDFATFVRGGDCTSCGECARVCPNEVIQMEWQPMTGSPFVGQWRDQPPAAAAPQPKRSWWDILVGEPA
jgi:formate hydrogenlyase subunit 6/NADH:ubiquinone oxidoreductase subunit I